MAMNPISRAKRPGGAGTVKPGTGGKKFDLGTLKGPATGPLSSTGKKPPARIGKGLPDNMPGMKPPNRGRSR